MCILNIIEKIKNCICFDPEYKKLIMVDNGIIGDTIDLVINAVNGKLDFASAITTGKKWCMFAFLKILSMRSKKKNKNRSQIQP